MGDASGFVWLALAWLLIVDSPIELTPLYSLIVRLAEYSQRPSQRKLL